MIEDQKDEIKSQLAKSIAFLKVGAKNFLYLKGIARDLNVSNQNVQELVRVMGGKPRASGQTDMHILKPDEVQKKLEVEVGKITPTLEKVEPKKPTPLGKKGISAADKIKKIFSPSNILKVLGGLALVTVALSALWEGITNAFNDFAKSGSIFEALKEGISTIVEFLTGGFIDKDTIKKLMDNVAEFLKPVADIFVGIYDKITSFITEKVNAIKAFFGIPIEPKKEMPDVKGEEEARKKAEEEAKKQKKISPPPVPVEAKEPVVAEPTEKKAAPAAAPAAAAEPSVTPTPAPAGKAVSTSEAKPQKLSSESGKKAMLSAMNDAKITEPTARAAIMAQVGHESGNFTTLSENLNYRPQTLLKIFPKYFRSPEEAEQTAAAGPEAIANRVYGGRMGNAPDEGFKYRGRGFIQLTGKDNYKRFGYASNPDDVAKPESAADSAIKFMMGFKGDWSDVKAVTKFVNGGYIGLDDRAKHFQAYLNDPTITKVDAIASAQSGGAVSTSSTQIASNQRQQQKPSTPIIIDASKTSTTVVKKNENVVGQKPDTMATADMLAARAA